MVKPSQCGWRMILSLTTLEPINSTVHTSIANNSDSILDKVAASDPDIPTGIASEKWYEVPGIWWGVVERLSWTMLGIQYKHWYNFRHKVHHNIAGNIFPLHHPVQ